jgi:hypothetical protein
MIEVCVLDAFDNAGSPGRVVLLERDDPKCRFCSASPIDNCYGFVFQGWSSYFCRGCVKYASFPEGDRLFWDYVNKQLDRYSCEGKVCQVVHLTTSKVEWDIRQSFPKGLKW